MTKLQFRRDDIIFREGDPSDFVGRIISGEAEVVREHGDKALVLGIVRTGEFFGEMGVLEGCSRSATVRANGDLTIELIVKEDFLKLISTDSDTSLQLLTRLSERLRRTDNQLANAKFSEQGLTDSAIFGDMSAPDDAAETKDEVGIMIFAESNSLEDQIPRHGIAVSKFPFLIGRQPDERELSSGASLGTPVIHLQLRDEMPYRLSRIHFAVQSLVDDKYAIRDWGSALGTEVNGQFLGADFARAFVELEVGDNLVVAGGAESPFAFRVIVGD
ncbi:MAG: cyclic nucleotide-binding domain-containing protein [Rhodospirillales bacterium]